MEYTIMIEMVEVYLQYFWDGCKILRVDYY